MYKYTLTNEHPMNWDGTVNTIDETDVDKLTEAEFNDFVNSPQNIYSDLYYIKAEIELPQNGEDFDYCYRGFDIIFEWHKYLEEEAKTTMIKTIWKYELGITGTQHIMIPSDYKILTVQNQNGKLCLWSEVNPNDELTNITIEIFGTGNPIEYDVGVERKYITSVQMGDFVWHVYHRKS